MGTSMAVPSGVEMSGAEDNLSKGSIVYATVKADKERVGADVMPALRLGK